jgi:MFS family permease
MLIPLAAKYHYTLVVVLRVMTGVAQGFMYPCCLPLIAKWSPMEERSSLSSFLAAGASLGTIMSTAITGPVCSTGYWYLNFIALGKLFFQVKF